MDEYTFKDLIMDPETSGLENLIGKEVYFDDVPIHCIKWANEDYEVGILKDVRKDNPAPFFVKTSSGCVLNYPCIIPKKEEPKPKYVPFESIEEFVERYTEVKEGTEFGTFEDNLLQCGMWIKSKDDDDLSQVTVIREYGICIDTMSTYVSWKNLLDDFEFVDDSPCGRLMEEKHE